jgi:UDP-N-acetylmuramate--alanine ligase
MIDLSSYTSVYFLGIGGIGMSGLAQYLKAEGYQVAGYDRTPSTITELLVDLDIQISFDDHVEVLTSDYLIPATTLVVYTPAIPQNSVLLGYFAAQGYTQIKRAALLGAVTRSTFCYAVAGTHGKTTTSSLLAAMLVEAQSPFTTFLGGVANQFKSNYINLGNQVSLVEADEFDRSFLQLTPQAALITNIDPDHLDIYGDRGSFYQGFADFADLLTSPKRLVVHESVMGIDLDQAVIYGEGPSVDYRLLNHRVVDEKIYFDIQTPQGYWADISWHLPGVHNALNALGAFALGMETELDPKALIRGIEKFEGVQRRFSIEINRPELVMVDDYAHHPTEIEAVYLAVAQTYPERRKTVVFQPHLFTRTRDFAQDFADALGRFDQVILLDIYPARELPIPGIDKEYLLSLMNHPQAVGCTKQELIPLLQETKPELLVVLGAGDIGVLVQEIKKNLQ